MATGPEHYREAEKLLRLCQIDRANDREAATYPAVEDGVNSIGNALAAAQVHATLALAAATALMAATGDCSPADEDGWKRVASEQPPFQLKDGA